MFRKVYDFIACYQEESQATDQLLGSLTDASLAQQITPGGRSLGQIAWHITLTLGEMLSHAQLPLGGPPSEASAPHTVVELRGAYRRAAQKAMAAVAQSWNDAMLVEEISIYGQLWTRGQGVVCSPPPRGAPPGADDRAGPPSGAAHPCRVRATAGRVGGAGKACPLVVKPFPSAGDGGRPEAPSGEGYFSGAAR